MTPLNLKNSYPDWLKEVKERIKIARVKVALATNHELIAFYWDLGKIISDTQTASNYRKRLEPRCFGKTQ
jgi:hypothetical protein